VTRAPTAAEVQRAAQEAGATADPALPVPLPVCDPGMFRGILGEIAAAADPGTEADKVGVFGSLLSEVSALAGHNPHVPIGNTRHPLLIWTLLIGRTATGRKGEATGTASRVVREANPEVYGIEESGLSSGEGLVERIRDPDDEEDQGGTMDKRPRGVEASRHPAASMGRRPAQSPEPQADRRVSEPHRHHRPHHPARVPRQAARL